MQNSVEMIGINKKFGSVQALKDAKLELRRGEIHALLGENGAGKSTLMNVLSGIYFPDSGTIKINGEIVHIKSPIDAINKGIGMVHQRFKLASSMTVLENIIAGRNHGILLDRAKLYDEVNALSKKYGLDINLNATIRELSVAKKQRVELLKVLYGGADILILDEPTTVLTPQESAKLFAIIRSMADDGKSIIIITHKMLEVMNISNRVSVMRKGEYITTYKTNEVDTRTLTNAMVGKEIDLKLNYVKYYGQSQVLLDIEKMSVLGEGFFESIHDVTFQIKRGEILGVAGVSGNGQRTLCEAICGLQDVSSGLMNFLGNDIKGLSPKRVMNMGISLSFVPEDRLGMGLISNMDIIDNVLLKEYSSQSGIFINKKSSIDIASDLVAKLNIDTPSIYHPIRLLSGGNIQKVLLGREIENNPQLMVVAYPSRGLDIASSHLMYELLNEQKLKGIGILLVAEDLDDLLAVSDRIMVICNGRITGIINNREEFDKQKIGELMSA